MKKIQGWKGNRDCCAWPASPWLDRRKGGRSSRGRSVALHSSSIYPLATCNLLLVFSSKIQRSGGVYQHKIVDRRLSKIVPLCSATLRPWLGKSMCKTLQLCKVPSFSSTKRIKKGVRDHPRWDSSVKPSHLHSVKVPASPYLVRKVKGDLWRKFCRVSWLLQSVLGVEWCMGSSFYRLHSDRSCWRSWESGEELREVEK